MRFIETFDRHEIETCFFSRQPYALLSIRRPGSPFANELVKGKRSARCDLALHEWNVDQPPYPLPHVELSSRQALKVVDFVVNQLQEVNQLVVQSEFRSSQLTAIADAIGHWTNVTVVRDSYWPSGHEATRVTLEMAMDSFDLANSVGSEFVVRRRNRKCEVTRLLELIFSITNVAMIHSSRVRSCVESSIELGAALDTALGVSLDPWTSDYQPAAKLKCETQGGHVHLRETIRTRKPKVCRFGGCPKCLESIVRWRSPVCVSLIFNPQHLPPTLLSALEAGVTWAIITNRTMVRPILRLAGQDAEMTLTPIRNHDLVLLTCGDNKLCKELIDVYEST